MNFQLSEDKAFGDEELQELFNGLETMTPGFIIADDVLIEDEDLVVLFEQLEDVPVHSPKPSSLDIIHSTVETVPLDSNQGKNLKDRISEDSGSEDGKLEPEYLNPDHIRETNFEENVESLEIPELHQQSPARIVPNTDMEPEKGLFPRDPYIEGAANDVARKYVRFTPPTKVLEGGLGVQESWENYITAGKLWAEWGDTMDDESKRRETADAVDKHIIDMHDSESTYLAPDNTALPSTKGTRPRREY
ncbi:hypothetical protein BHE90_009645 [Fusarium euwallaceae]|uniref:Uncharacterized protein n=1 Tax=Fusarium euwallaceae TaxID=1147111 RepID=A0A430LJL2_9HYPO|nr:hypothetical protein BHE90_009645 [Fusarium euwallaceae]